MSLCAVGVGERMRSETGDMEPLGGGCTPAGRLPAATARGLRTPSCTPPTCVGRLLEESECTTPCGSVVWWGVWCWGGPCITLEVGAPPGEAECDGVLLACVLVDGNAAP